MSQAMQPVSPEVHSLCVALANRCVYTIAALLRPNEQHEARRRFYEIARELLDKPTSEGEI